MKRLFSILVFMFSLTTQSQDIRVELIDTVEANEFNINRLEEYNDCTVRAISEGFNLSYLDALNVMDQMGRRRAKGMPLRDYVRGLRNIFAKHILFGANLQIPTLPKDFINTIAEEGYTYIVISHAHTFVIEQNRVGRIWYVKGNFDDMKKKILMYIKVKNEYEK